MSEKARLRKYEDDLNVSGAGVIILGIWSIVKVLIIVFIEAKDYVDFKDEEPAVRIISMILLVLLIAVISFIVMKVHLYIGLNAMRAAKGMEYKKGYFTATVIILILAVLSLILYKDSFKNIDKIDSTIASVIVDLTTIYIYAVVIMSTKKIKEFKTGEKGE